MIRGLMTDDEWAIVAPFLITLRCVAGARQPTIGGCWMVCSGSADRRTMARPAGGVRQLEFDLAAVPPLVSVWRMGCAVAGAGR